MRRNSVLSGFSCSLFVDKGQAWLWTIQWRLKGKCQGKVERWIDHKLARLYLYLHLMRTQKPNEISSSSRFVVHQSYFFPFWKRSSTLLDYRQNSKNTSPPGMWGRVSLVVAHRTLRIRQRIRLRIRCLTFCVRIWLVPLSNRYITLASSVDSDVNSCPVCPNWLRQWFQTLNLSFTFTILIKFQGRWC